MTCDILSKPDVGPSVASEGRRNHYNVVGLHLETLASYWSILPYDWPITVSGEPSCSILTEKAGPVLVISVTAPRYILAAASLEAQSVTILVNINQSEASILIT